ncbi:MAG: hypothetical protein WA890_23055 [Micromonospora sp.]
MTATQQRGTAATPSPIRLRTEVLDELTSAKGASTEVERARLLEIDRTTLYRIRGGQVPTLEVALRMAERLGTTVEQLFEVTA